MKFTHLARSVLVPLAFLVLLSTSRAPFTAAAGIRGVVVQMSMRVTHEVNKADNAEDSTVVVSISNILLVNKAITIDTVTITGYEGAGSVTANKTAPEASLDFLCADAPCTVEGVTVKMTAPCTFATAAGVPATVAVTVRCADDTSSSSSDICDSVLAKALEFTFIQHVESYARESCAYTPLPPPPALPEFAIDAVLNADDASMLLTGDDAVVRRYDVDPYLSNAPDVPVPARFSTIELAYAAPSANDEAAALVCATAFTKPVVLVDVHGDATYKARSEFDFKHSPDVGASSDMSFSFSATAKQVDEMVRATAPPGELEKIGAVTECVRIMATHTYVVPDDNGLVDYEGVASTIVATRVSLRPHVPVHVLVRLPSGDSADVLAANHNGERTDLESAYSTNLASATGASVVEAAPLEVLPDRTAGLTMLVGPQHGADVATTEARLQLSLKPAVEAAHAQFAAKHGFAPAVVSLQVRDTDVWSEPTPPRGPGEEPAGLSPLMIAAVCVGGVAVIAVVALVVVLKKQDEKEPTGAGAWAGSKTVDGVPVASV